MRITGTARRVTSAALLLTVLVSCGISEDGTPRDIPQSEQKDLAISSERGAGASTGTARIYLLAPEISGQAPQLQPVARDVRESAVPVLESLFAGPNTVERSRQFRTALPAGLRLLSARLQAGTLRVDVSPELLVVSGSDLIDALGEIVFTVSEIDGVRGVKITVDGADQQWPAGDGSLQSVPLTVYDYPGLVTSAQPAYPAIPTPKQS
jgi:spore germination protein GerM